MNPWAQLFEAIAGGRATIAQVREQYLRAWVAETGLMPSECELVEQTLHEPDPGAGLDSYRHTVRVYVRKKTAQHVETKGLVAPAGEAKAE